MSHRHVFSDVIDLCAPEAAQEGKTLSRDKLFCGGRGKIKRKDRQPQILLLNFEGVLLLQPQ